MGKAKKRFLIFFVTVIFIGLYIFFSSYKAVDELQFIPKWTVSIAEDDIQNDVLESEKDLIPFKLGKNLGFFTSDGQIAIIESFSGLATISSSLFATYGNVASTDLTGDVSANKVSANKGSVNSTDIFNAKGEIVASIEAAGNPFFTDFGNYLFLPGGMGVAQLNENGKIVWKYEDISPITAFSAYNDGCILGFAHGKLVKLSKNGDEVFDIFPGGSNFQVILGADSEPKNDLSACVSGIEKQRLIVYKTQGTQTKVVYHEYLDGNLREQTFVKFNNDGTKLFYNELNGLGIIDCSNFRSFHIPINGKIISITEMTEQNIFFVLCKESETYTVYIFEEFANLIGSYSYKAESSFIFAKENALYNGKDMTITKIEVKK